MSMSGCSNAGKGKKRKVEEGTLDLGEAKQEGRSPFRIDLIRQLIFSYLTNEDLLRARLVTMEWTQMATEEFRGRASNCPWIGYIQQDGDVSVFVLNAESVRSFIDLMTPSPIIPVQRVAIRLDPLSIEPSALLQLFTFLAPWIKTIHLCPWSPWGPWDLDTNAPLLGESGRKVVAWTFALQNFIGIQFPCLETLEVAYSSDYRDLHMHQTLVMMMMMLLKSLVQGAGNLNTFVYKTRFFENVDEAEETEREVTKGITLALPSSLKRLGFGGCSTVDYEALATLNLNLKEFLGMGKSESSQAFLRFLDGEKRSLARILLPRLEEIYRPEFPQLPLVTKLTMNVQPTSSLECLTAFPALTTLRIDMQMAGEGGFHGRRGNQQVTPTDLIHLPTHPSVQKLVVRGFRDDRIIMFDFLAHVLPNLIHMDFDCVDLSQLTKLFTHFPRLRSLHLGLDVVGYKELDLEAVLSGIPPVICSHTKAYSISDDVGFDAISAIAARDPTSTVGLVNLKDLEVLAISDSSRYQYELILTNLIFHTVFKKMPRLREIRLFGEIKKDCDSVLDALKERAIRVHVTTSEK